MSKNNERVVITGASAISTLGMNTSSIIESLLLKKRNFIEDELEINGIPIRNAGMCDREYLLSGKKSGGSLISRTIIHLIEDLFVDADVDWPNLDDKVIMFLGSTFGNHPDYYEFLQRMKELQFDRSIDNKYDKSRLDAIPLSIRECRFKEAQQTKDLEEYFSFHIHKYTVQAQCASSLVAIKMAVSLIKSRQCKTVLVGAYDFFNLMPYVNMRGNKMISDEPSQPFDRDNKGISLADGAGMILLESYEHAQKRGAKKFYGEINGTGLTVSQNDTTSSSPKGIIKAIDMAMEEAELTPKDIQLISPHGNGLPEMDRNELLAYKRYFGDEIYEIPITSYNANLGYSLAASGVLDMIISSDNMMNKRIIGTISPAKTDQELNLNYAFGDTIPKNINNYLNVKININGTASSVVVSDIIN